MIFVDTGAWFATFVPNDSDHQAANAWLDTNTDQLITTDYVIDELLTLLKIRGEFQRSLNLGRSIFAEEVVSIEWVLPGDALQAWEIFQQHHDKGWSFTDCVSRAVIERLHIGTAFAFDDHFRQFGTVTVVPQQVG